MTSTWGSVLNACMIVSDDCAYETVWFSLDKGKGIEEGNDRDKCVNQ